MAYQGDGIDGRLSHDGFALEASKTYIFTALQKNPTVINGISRHFYGRRGSTFGNSWAMRTVTDNGSGTLGNYPGFYVNDGTNGTKELFTDDAGVPVPVSVQSAGSWHQVGWVVTTDADSLVIDAKQIVDGVVIETEFHPDAGGGLPTTTGNNTLFGPNDGVTGFNAFGACQLAIWVVNAGAFEPTTQEWANMGGIGTRPGIYMSPRRYGTPFRYWPMVNSLTDLMGSGDDLAIEGGVSEISNPQGVEVLYSSQPDGTGSIDRSIGSFSNGTATATTGIMGDFDGGGGDWRRFLVVFDLTEDGAIPTDATASAWTLTLNVTTAAASAANAECRMIAGDASDIVEAEVTWANRSTTPGAWTTPGGDFTGSAVAFTYPTDAANNIAVDVTALIQTAISNGWSKVGFVFKTASEVSDTVTCTVGAGENATESNRPKLEGTWVEASSGGIAGARGIVTTLLPMILRNKRH
jgi:hypothetical protein